MSLDGQLQIASAFGGKLFKSIDYGNSWKELTNIPDAYWKCVAMSSNGSFCAAIAKNYNIIYSYDSFNNYSISLSNKNWTGISVSGNGTTVIACEYGGKLYRGYNNGYTLSFVDINIERNWMGCASSGTGKYLTAVSDYIYISKDKGITWSPKSEKNNWFSVSMSYDGKYQTAVDVSGRIYISSNYGETWIKIKEIVNVPYINVSVSGNGKYQTLFVTGGLMYISNDYGNTWNSVLNNKQWFGVSTSYDGKYQTLCEYSGNIYTTRDYGISWNMVNMRQQNWSSVCISRGNITFADDLIPPINIIKMLPSDIAPPLNITIPIMPNEDIYAVENRSLPGTSISNDSYNYKPQMSSNSTIQDINNTTTSIVSNIPTSQIQDATTIISKINTNTNTGTNVTVATNTGTNVNEANNIINSENTNKEVKGSMSIWYIIIPAIILFIVMIYLHIQNNQQINNQNI